MNKTWNFENARPKSLTPAKIWYNLPWMVTMQEPLGPLFPNMKLTDDRDLSVSKNP